MNNKHGTTIMAKGKQIGNCTVLVTEGLSIREALVMTIRMKFQRIIIESDSHVVIKFMGKLLFQGVLSTW